jgi:NO-binding membrane sensor protein with MHYT domain
VSTPTATTSSRTDRSSLALRVVGALALGFSAYLHFKIASNDRPLFEDGGVRLSGLFVAQAIAATLVSLWVLAQGIRLAWLAFGAVAIASLVAVVMSTYVEIPAIGPLPKIYDPVWYDDKVLAAVSAGIASLVAVVALATARRTR